MAQGRAFRSVTRHPRGTVRDPAAGRRLAQGSLPLCRWPTRRVGRTPYKRLGRRQVPIRKDGLRRRRSYVPGVIASLDVCTFCVRSSTRRSNCSGSRERHRTSAAFSGRETSTVTVRSLSPASTRAPWTLSSPASTRGSRSGVRPSDPDDLPPLAHRLHRMAVRAGQTEAAEHLAHLFGRTTCPDCTAGFAVSDQVAAKGVELP